MRTNVQEKIITGHKIGGLVLLITIVLYVLAIPGIVMGGIFSIICGLWLGFGWITLRSEGIETQ